MQQVRNLKKKAKFEFGLHHFFHSEIMPPFPLEGVSVSYRHILPFFTCTSHSTNETAQTFFLGLPIAKKVFPSCQSRICFQLTWPLGQVSYCHHFSSVVRPSTFHILIFSSETTGPIATKLWWNGPWMVPFQNLSGDPDFQPRWPPS